MTTTYEIGLERLRDGRWCWSIRSLADTCQIVQDCTEHHPTAEAALADALPALDRIAGPPPVPARSVWFGIFRIAKAGGMSELTELKPSYDDACVAARILGYANRDYRYSVNPVSVEKTHA